VLAEPGNFPKQLFRFPPFFVHAQSAYANPDPLTENLLRASPTDGSPSLLAVGMPDDKVTAVKLNPEETGR